MLDQTRLYLIYQLSIFKFNIKGTQPTNFCESPSVVHIVFVKIDNDVVAILEATFNGVDGPSSWMLRQSWIKADICSLQFSQDRPRARQRSRRGGNTHVAHVSAYHQFISQL